MCVGDNGFDVTGDDLVKTLRDIMPRSEWGMADQFFSQEEPRLIRHHSAHGTGDLTGISRIDIVGQHATDLGKR